MILLAIQNLTLSFGGRAVVKDVNLAIGKGEMLALVGESGSGKSLTALSCLGLQPPGAVMSGSITMAGQEIVGASEGHLRAIRGKQASMIFQEPMTALNPLHTIGKQIGEMLAVHSGGVSHASQVLALLDQVGLPHFKSRLNAYPHEMSGGERQRAMIAMAIANSPALLIADEPTTAVDVTIQVKLLKLLKDLQKERGMAMLFITHDLTIVKRLADRVAVMKNGEIVEQGKVSDIFAAPKHPYTQMLLASEPKGSAPALPPNAQSLLSCETLKVWFPIKKGLLKRTADYVKAVDGISVTIPESSTLGVVGESGSGKTTLGMAILRLIKSEGKIVFSPSTFQGEGRDEGSIAELEHPIRGENPHPNLLPGREKGQVEIRLDQLRSRAMRPLRRQMQLVFQDPFSSLNPRMTIEQIITEGLTVHEPGLSDAGRTARLDAILRDVGLTPDIKHRLPHEFSGGQRQRISIARAMILNPRLVVLDEPTSALDLTVQSQIIDLLRKFQLERGVSYIFISHDLRVVRAIAHRILVMRGGHMVEEGDTKTIFENPREDYTKTLIAAAFLK